MSHFLAIVIVPKRTRNIDAKVAKLLAPYDEKKKVRPYICASVNEVRAKKEKVIKDIACGDTSEYLAPYRNGKIERMSLSEFARSWYSQEVDENGNLLSSYNPKSKFDYYGISGRWKDEFPENVCPVSELPKDFSCFAIVTPNGEWHEKGKMGWWAIVTNEKPDDSWDLEVALILENYKDHLAVAVDCHI